MPVWRGAQVLLIVGALCCANSVVAQMIVPAGAIAAPAGWVTVPATNRVIEFATAPRDSGLARIIIEPPRALGGMKIDAALTQWLQRSLSTRLELSLENSVTVGRTTGGQVAAWADETPDIRGSRDEMRVIGIAIKHRDDTFTPVLFIARGDLQHYELARTFGKWMREVPLRGESRERRWSPFTPPAPAPLAGLWWGVQMQNQLNIFGGSSLIADRSYVTLYRSGMAYRQLPDGGRVENADPAQLCAGDSFDDCGTFRITRDSIHFDWFTSEGMVESDAAELVEAGTPDARFFFNGRWMNRVTPLTTLRLDGEYTTISGTSGPSGSISSSNSIMFFPDGRYEATRFVGFAMGGSTLDPSPTVVGSSTSGLNRGTYEIRGYTLIMRPVSGPVRHATIVIEDPDKRPVSSVFIDDAYYRR